MHAYLSGIKTYLFQPVLHCVLYSALQPPYSHHFPDSLYRNILAVDLVTKTRNSLSSSYHFSHHSPRLSQNKHIYHLLNLTLHLGKCWILMWDVLSTPARHGPLGLHSGSRKTWGGWYKTAPILRNVLEQPPLLTQTTCVLLLDGELVLLVGHCFHMTFSWAH